MSEIEDFRNKICYCLYKYQYSANLFDHAHIMSFKNSQIKIWLFGSIAGFQIYQSKCLLNDINFNESI